jgi:hypothetical protein
MASPRLPMRVLAVIAACALVLVAGVAGATGLPPGGTFVDDDGNAHEGMIEAIHADAVTAGCNPPTNDRYCPASGVTRAQMAAFIVRAVELPATNIDYFDDDNGSIFEDDINRLAAAGVTVGCNPPAGDHFCPDGTVTRGQMAAFLVRAFHYDDDGGGDLFDDDDGSVFESDIDKLKTAGVTVGCNPPANDRFCPTANVRRDQMASFLARALELDPMEPPPRETDCPVEGACSPLWAADAAGQRDVEQWRSLVEKHWQPDRVECVLGIIERESWGDPQAHNTATNVLGLMQHLGKYWNSRAVASGFVDGNGITAHPYNAEANIAAGRWLADWAQQYQGDWRKPWTVTPYVPACQG